MNAVRNIGVVGASGHAKVVIDIIEKQGCFSIVGLIDRFCAVGEETFGYRVIGMEDDLPKLCKQFDFDALIVAIGDNFTRRDVVQRIEAILPGLEYVSAIHPSASVGKGASIGAGTVIMAGAAVNSDCRVGEHCILNTHCSLDHDSQLADYASLAPSSATGGHVTIGVCSAISIGVNIKHGVNIGEHTIIGVGAAVVKDVGDMCVAYGVPARVMRSRNLGDSYL